MNCQSLSKGPNQRESLPARKKYAGAESGWKAQDGARHFSGVTAPPEQLFEAPRHAGATRRGRPLIYLLRLCPSHGKPSLIGRRGCRRTFLKCTQIPKEPVRKALTKDGGDAGTRIRSLCPVRRAPRHRFTSLVYPGPDRRLSSRESLLHPGADAVVVVLGVLGLDDCNRDIGLVIIRM